MAHPKAEKLIQAQLQHILSLLQSADTINAEADALITALANIPVGKLVDVAKVQAIAVERILNHPIQPHLLQVISSQVQYFIQHPINANINLEQVIPEETVEHLAKYLSTQKEHREALIHRIFSNPTYAQMLSQTVSQAINDYMDNNVLAKKMPGVGGLMKLGKSVIERATDSNLDEALQVYLSKNINNLIATSEKMANRHLGDEQVHQFIIKGWKQVRKMPASLIQAFITADNIHESAEVVSQTWEHLRQSNFLKQHVTDGIAHWFEQNQHLPLSAIMQDVNLDSAVIQQEIRNVALPIVQHLIDSGYMAGRVEKLLRDFYESDAVSAILAE